uniref:Uncharacterized protein n=1 Tax=Octopus bimaculoides TaxID=37653 RepID=A0A0L8HYW1_OCTBM
MNIMQCPPFRLSNLFEISRDQDNLIEWVKTYGLLAEAHVCDDGHNCSFAKFRRLQDGYSWKCTARQCRKRFSIRKGSFFQKSNLPLKTILLFLYWWSIDVPLRRIMQELQIASWSTVVDWANFC